MNIQIESNDRHARVSLAGELTIYTVAEVKARLGEAMNTADIIDVDMSEVSEMDTAGLQLMLIAKSNPGKDVRFGNHSRNVRRLVDLANLGTVLGDPMIISAQEH